MWICRSVNRNLLLVHSFTHKLFSATCLLCSSHKSQVRNLRFLSSKTLVHVSAIKKIINIWHLSYFLNAMINMTESSRRIFSRENVEGITRTIGAHSLVNTLRQVTSEGRGTVEYEDIHCWQFMSQRALDRPRSSSLRVIFILYRPWPAQTYLQCCSGRWRWC